MMRACCLLLALVLTAVPAHAQRVSLVDRIVAVVNSEIVTLSELNERVDFALRQLQRQGTPAPDRAALQAQALERLILDKAQLQLAKDSGIRIDDAQLDRAIERIAENNNLSMSAFRAALEKDGVRIAQFREEVRQQIALQRLREREVDDKIQVSESEVDLYLEQAKTQDAADVDASYNLAHILVRIPEQASPERVEQARQRAEKARGEAAGGTDFGKVAASYSDSPDALRGGVMGWRSGDRLPEIFSVALKTMRPGDLSPVLRSPAGFHVIKLLDRRGGSPVASGAPVTQTRARHILVRTSELVSESEAQRRLANLRQRILSGTDFAEMARLNSEDGTATRGGDLDWVYPGDTVPEFERAMNELKPGEVSQPVKSPFGWHLIQVMERRSAGVSEERRRTQARVALRDRKSDEAYQEWLRQLRDRTYVDLRLEEK